MWFGRLTGLCCTLVLLLIVTHVALMTTERHIDAMGPLMDGSPAAAAAGQGDRSGEGVPEEPHHPVLGDCPARQAVLPLLLILLALGGLVALRSTISHDTGHQLGWHPRLSPPPLAPARRRALLQVFLN